LYLYRYKIYFMRLSRNHHYLAPAARRGELAGSFSLMGSRISRLRCESAGFTLIEILASAAIIAVLASLIVTSLGQAKSAVNRGVCVSNMHTLSACAADNGNTFPNVFGDDSIKFGSKATASWDALTLPYITDGGSTDKPCKVLQCPEDKRPSTISKGVFPRSYKISSQPANQSESPMGVVGYYPDPNDSNNSLPVARSLAQITKPSDTIMLFECFTDTTITPDYISNWQFRSGNSMGSGWNSARVTGYRADGSKKLYHDKYINYAMADGHVETHDLAWPYTPSNHWNAIR
jgi:prepilin-type N-terminal cleavage/methylation domain-containing protein/prepilin-type processing-associated H-X9-DG protein